MVSSSKKISLSFHIQAVDHFFACSRCDKYQERNCFWKVNEDFSLPTHNETEKLRWKEIESKSIKSTSEIEMKTWGFNCIKSRLQKPQKKIKALLSENKVKIQQTVKTWIVCRCSRRRRAISVINHLSLISTTLHRV